MRYYSNGGTKMDCRREMERESKREKERKRGSN
jgi:hypothetical protein